MPGGGARRSVGERERRKGYNTKTYAFFTGTKRSIWCFSTFVSLYEQNVTPYGRRDEHSWAGARGRGGGGCVAPTRKGHAWSATAAGTNDNKAGSNKRSAAAAECLQAVSLGDNGCESSHKSGDWLREQLVP